MNGVNARTWHELHRVAPELPVPLLTPANLFRQLGHKPRDEEEEGKDWYLKQ